MDHDTRALHEKHQLSARQNAQATPFVDDSYPTFYGADFSNVSPPVLCVTSLKHSLGSLCLEWWYHLLAQCCKRKLFICFRECRTSNHHVTREIPSILPSCCGLEHILKGRQTSLSPFVCDTKSLISGSSFSFAQLCLS